MRTGSDQGTTGSPAGMASRLEGADEAALADYYRGNRVKLLAFASRLTGDRSAAEDMVQQAFANTIAAIRNGAEIVDLSHWLHRVVRNLWTNERRRSAMLDQPLQEDLCVDPALGPHLTAELRDEYDLIHGTLDAMPRRQRAALLLTAVRGLSQEEAAAAMDTTVDSIRQAVFRARRAMRAAVDSGRETFGFALLWLFGSKEPAGGTPNVIVRARQAVAVRVGGGAGPASSGPLDRLLHAAAQPATSLVAAAIAVSPILVLSGPPGSGGRPGDPTRAVSGASSLAAWPPTDEALAGPTGGSRGRTPAGGKDTTDALPPGGMRSRVKTSPTGGVESPKPERAGGSRKTPSKRLQETGGAGAASGDETGAAGDVGGDENGEIAFATARDGNWEIYSMKADGSGSVDLSNNSSNDVEPDWSADGSKLVFLSLRDGNAEIYSMNSDGSGQTRLTDDSTTDNTPVWSPDGTRIAFRAERDGNRQIYVMNADGSGQTNLSNNSHNDASPDWSPDGTKIAFSSDRDGWEHIYVMNAGGSGQTRLTNTGGAEDGSAQWSPDGSKIVFHSSRDGNKEIYVMNSDGAGQTRLTTNSASDASPAWSSDGTKIAFQSDRDGDLEIYTMNADGGGETNMSQAASSLDATPAW